MSLCRCLPICMEWNVDLLLLAHRMLSASHHCCSHSPPQGLGSGSQGLGSGSQRASSLPRGAGSEALDSGASAFDVSRAGGVKPFDFAQRHQIAGGSAYDVRPTEGLCPPISPPFPPDTVFNLGIHSVPLLDSSVFCRLSPGTEADLQAGSRQQRAFPAAVASVPAHWCIWCMGRRHGPQTPSDLYVLSRTRGSALLSDAVPI